MQAPRPLRREPVAESCQVSTSVLFAKYSLAGVVNTAIGYAVIFGCMRAGLGPEMSNAVGYAVGLAVSFVQLRHWVFRPSRSLAADWLRFLSAFLLAYSANFIALQTLLALAVNVYVAQLAACAVYVIVSFLLSSRFVFSKRAVSASQRPEAR